MNRFEIPDSRKNFISVIIPTLRRDSISEVLSALEKQTRKPDEIIVVEDVNNESASVIRNKGIEKCKGNLIAFLDDDTIPPENWLENFEVDLMKLNADGISGNYIETDPFLHQIRLMRKFPNECIINPNGYFGIGGNVMYTRSCLEKSKKEFGFVFDPSFKNTSEDIELAWRLSAIGCKLVYSINHVTHLKKVNLKRYLKTQFIRGKGLYDLYLLSKKYQLSKFRGESLLWGSEHQSNRVGNWLRIFLLKFLGPFCRKDFSSTKYFLMYWLGEKVKSFGFAYQMLLRKLER